ncbi:MAG: DUF763 domain-containing protein [Candidatus Latescibacteria bacterium]|nr:DUF763 domain-containing protein [Candidatus Latescibacterota bacterium]
MYKGYLRIVHLFPNHTLPRSTWLSSNDTSSSSSSFRDPARYSFAHGGKDGHPYPVDRTNYDGNIQILETAISKAKMGNREKLEAIKRLGLVR